MRNRSQCEGDDRYGDQGIQTTHEVHQDIRVDETHEEGDNQTQAADPQRPQVEDQVRYTSQGQHADFHILRERLESSALHL